MSYPAKSVASSKHKHVVNFVNLSISSPVSQSSSSSSLGLFPVHKRNDYGNHEVPSPSYIGHPSIENHRIVHDEGFEDRDAKQENRGLLLKCNSLPTFSIKLTVDKKPLQTFVTEPYKSAVGSSSRSATSYRPNSSHQYLSPVELRDSTVAETNIRLGKPTRATLLRDRYRRKSLSNIPRGCGTPENAKTYRKPVRSSCGSLTNLISSLASDNNETTHGFLTGARYNRPDFIDQLLSRDQTGRQRQRRDTPPMTVHHNSTTDISSSLFTNQDATPSAGLYNDESKSTSADDSSDDDLTLRSACSTSRNAGDGPGEGPLHVRPRSALRRKSNQLAVLSCNVHRKHVAEVEHTGGEHQSTATSCSERTTGSAAVPADQPRARTAVFSSRKPPVSSGFGRPTTAKSRVMRSCPSPYGPVSPDTPGMNPLFESDSGCVQTGFITTAYDNAGCHFSSETSKLFSHNHASAARVREDSDKESDQLTDLPNLDALLSKGDEIELEDIEDKSWHDMESIGNDITVLETGTSG